MPQGAPPPYNQAPAAYPQAPAPYPQAPAPCPQAPNPYAMAPAQLPPSQPATPTPPKRRTALVALAIVLGLAVLLAASYVIGRVTAPTIAAPSPTAPPSSSLTPLATQSGSGNGKGFVIAGSTLSAKTFTATLPEGYVLGDSNGVDNDGKIVKDRNAIVYYGPRAGTAEANCTSSIEYYRSQYPGTVTTLPTLQWGHRDATVVQLAAKSPNTGRTLYLVLTCVDRGTNQSAALESETDSDNPDEVRAAVSTLVSSWTWL